MADINRTRGHLLGKVSDPNEKGIWEILGEDPNCDFHGTHIMPRLAIVEGKYVVAVEYALTLSGFFQWGSGGDIRKLVVKKLESQTIQLKKDLEQKKILLQTELDALNNQLKAL